MEINVVSHGNPPIIGRATRSVGTHRLVASAPSDHTDISSRRIVKESPHYTAVTPMLSARPIAVYAASQAVIKAL